MFSFSNQSVFILFNALKDCIFVSIDFFGTQKYENLSSNANRAPLSFLLASATVAFRDIISGKYIVASKILHPLIGLIRTQIGVTTTLQSTSDNTIQEEDESRLPPVSFSLRDY